MKIVQIVPLLPPPFEGVGTYAIALAGALARRQGMETRFVVGDPAWHGGADGAGAVPARSAADLLAAIGEDRTVLLHYANYGYQPRGCPHWLVEGLRRWHARGGGRRLATLFHEVCASGPPWRSSFWLRPVQRRLAARMVRASDALATTLESYGALLRLWAGEREIAVMPVFSTVGEPATVPPLSGRARRIVVFGGAGIRRRAYGRFLPALAATVRALAAAEICDTGPAIALPAAVGGVPVRALGVLPPGEVEDLLLGSTAGFLAYPPAYLPKSTIFAAYCAHGVMPVCASSQRDDRGPLVPGEHYLPPGPALPSGEAELQAVAGRARAWYLEHSLERQLASFHRMVSGGEAAR